MSFLRIPVEASSDRVVVRPTGVEATGGTTFPGLSDSRMPGILAARRMKTEAPMNETLRSADGPPRSPDRRAVIRAVMTVIAAVACMAFLYSREYIDATDSAAVESVIDARIGVIHATDVHVLESTNVGNNLFVLFEQLSDESDIVCGVALFYQGLFGGHCLRSVSHSDWPLYTWSVVEKGVKDYLVIYGIHEPSAAETIRIYPEDVPSSVHGEPSRDYSGMEPLYAGAAEAPLLDVVGITQEQAESLYHPTLIHYYDADGNELDARELAAEFGYDGRTGGGTAYSSQSSLYVFFAVIVLLTFVIARFFLRP